MSVMLSVFWTFLCCCLVVAQEVSIRVRYQDTLPIPACMICQLTCDTCFGTDINGYATFHATDSAGVLQLSASGFQDTLLYYRAGIDTLVIEMSEVTSIERLKKITVTSNRIYREISRLESRSVQFTQADILHTAGAAGDVSRYIATLPSTVASIGEGFDNTLYVRGGRPSEILFLVDGIEFENINHFSKSSGSGGPIGFINSEFIERVNFYAGAMPFEFPSRLSSVVDISMRSGGLTKYNRTAGVKLTGGMLSVDGPFPNKDVSFAGAARYIDFTPFSKVFKDKGIPRFGDLFVKLTFIKNENVELRATGLLSVNNYKYTFPVVYPSKTGNARFNNLNSEIERIVQGGGGITAELSNHGVHQFNAAISFRNGLYQDSLSEFTSSFFKSSFAQNPFSINRSLRTMFSVKYKVKVPVAAHDTISGGVNINSDRFLMKKADYSQHSGNYVECVNGSPITADWTKISDADSIFFRGQEYGWYLGIHFKRGILKIDAGTRADYYGLLENFSLSPSIAVSISPDDVGTFLMSYGLYHQFPSEMPLILFNNFASGGYMTNASLKTTELSLLKKIQPYRSVHYGLGYEKILFNMAMLQGNMYYKWYDREFISENPYYISILTIRNDGTYANSKQDGKRKSMGAELVVRSMGTAWYNYSVCGSVFRVHNKYKDGTWYKDWTDVGYTLNISGGVSFLKHHKASFTANVMGGRPYTEQEIASDCIGRKYAVIPEGTRWFGSCLDRIFSVDVRYECRHTIRRTSIEGSLEILNLFNSQPVLERHFNGERFIDVTPFGLTPIIGVSISR